MKRQDYVQKLFSNLAPDYDRLNSIISLNQHHRWRNFAVRKAKLPDEALMLDICTGTADLAIEAAKQSAKINVVGLDFCQEMLDLGRKKVVELGCQSQVELREAEVSDLPFSDNTFDAVTMGFGLRHVRIPDIFLEVRRVLKPGGRFVTLDTGRPERLIPRLLHRLYFYHLMPFLGRIFHGDKKPFCYLPASLDIYLPSQAVLAEMMRQAGFRQVEYFNLLLGAAAVHVAVK
ncbi:MAG: ubiquinone/menaquinone biosynthesis methyltransferase [bacterium]|nr:ubiquinone/menaquinone biosynthesis methyltransferase [bacterium]